MYVHIRIFHHPHCTKVKSTNGSSPMLVYKLWKYAYFFGDNSKQVKSLAVGEVTRWRRLSLMTSWSMQVQASAKTSFQSQHCKLVWGKRPNLSRNGFLWVRADLRSFASFLKDMPNACKKRNDFFRGSRHTSSLVFQELSEMRFRGLWTP